METLATLVGVAMFAGLCLARNIIVGRVVFAVSPVL